MAKIEKIGVLGSGTMGSGIIQVLAQNLMVFYLSRTILMNDQALL